MLLVHAQQRQIFLPLLITGFPIDTQRRLVVVEIVLAFDRLLVPAILGLQRRPGTKNNGQGENRQDDSRFNCHRITPRLIV